MFLPLTPIQLATIAVARQKVANEQLETLKKIEEQNRETLKRIEEQNREIQKAKQDSAPRPNPHQASTVDSNSWTPDPTDPYNPFPSYGEHTFNSRGFCKRCDWERAYLVMSRQTKCSRDGKS